METKKIKVMVVDDSFFMRKLLRELLESDNQIAVVASASDGAEAIASCLQYNPDVITMDYNMPVMNGIDTVKKIMQLQLEKKPAILMISAYTKSGASSTFECLQAGAVDFIQKPSGELSLDINSIRKEILGKVHLASKAHIKELKPQAVKPVKTIPNNTTTPDKLLVIGASTGGPPQVEFILSQLPQSLNMGIIVVQHMPKYFTKSFSERLNRFTPINVKEASEGDFITSTQVLVAPGNYDITIVNSKPGMASRNYINFSENLNKEGPHPSIDTTMISAANAFPNKIVAVILSGMGVDGTLGAKAVKDAGGYVIVQDPSTAVIDSMPSSIINLGYADEILSPKDIIKRIIELSSMPNYGN